MSHYQQKTMVAISYRCVSSGEASRNWPARGNGSVKTHRVRGRIDQIARARSLYFALWSYWPADRLNLKIDILDLIVWRSGVDQSVTPEFPI